MRLCFATALVVRPSRTPENLTYTKCSPMYLWFSIAPMRDVSMLVKLYNAPLRMSYAPTELSTFMSVMYKVASILVSICMQRKQSTSTFHSTMVGANTKQLVSQQHQHSPEHAGHTARWRDVHKCVIHQRISAFMC